MLLRGGRRGLLAFCAEEGLEAMDADVFGVVTDSAPGEGVSISALMADGDSDDMVLGSVSQLFSSSVVRVGWKGRVCGVSVDN